MASKRAAATRYTVEIAEVTYSARRDTIGRVLLVAGNDELRVALDRDFAFHQRFGALGLQSVEKSEFFGLPIVRDGELESYLLGAFLPAVRGAPFRGFLVSRHELERCGWNLRGLMEAWHQTLDQDRGPIEQYEPQIDRLEFSSSNRSTKKVRRLVKQLESGAVVRCSADRIEPTVFGLLDSVISARQLAYYCWTTAEFDFPWCAEGARLHLAALPESSDWQTANDTAHAEQREGAVVAPDAGPTISAVQLDSRRNTNEPARQRLRIPWRRLAVALVVVGVVVVLGRGLRTSNGDGADDRDEGWWSQQLGRASFGRGSVADDISLVAESIELLHNDDPASSARAKAAVDRLLRHKILDVQDRLSKKVRSDHRALDSLEIGRWREALQAAEGVPFERKPNVSKLRVELARAAAAGLSDEIARWTEASDEAVRSLRESEQIARLAPQQLGDLAARANQKLGWFQTKLTVDSMRESGPAAYERFVRVHDVIDAYRPGNQYERYARDIEKDNLAEWAAHQLAVVKPLYRRARRGDAAVQWQTLLDELDRYDRIPQAPFADHARKAARGLNELLDGRSVTLQLESVEFGSRLRKKIDDERDERTERAEKAEPPRPALPVRVVLTVRRGGSVHLRDGGAADIRVPVSRSSSATLSLALDYDRLGSVTLPPLDVWLGPHDSLSKLEFIEERRLLGDELLLTITYRVPTATEVGLPPWP